MSVLYLVRHGQASFGQANYDRLSELGVTQCELLGDYWVRWGVDIHAVYTGTLERQRASLEAANQAFVREGKPLPPATEIEGLNEYDTAGILTGSIPDLISRHPDILEMMKKAFPEGKPDLVGNRKDFQRVFSRVMDLWVAGRLSVKGLESWRDFIGRVNAALERIMGENPTGRTVAVFTSGGPVSAAMQRALGTGDKVSLDLGWAIANASITEFRYSGDRFSLFSFNTTPQLADPSLVTYR